VNEKMKQPSLRLTKEDKKMLERGRKFREEMRKKGEMI